MTLHRPRWFSDDYVVVSTAPTCGLTKGGRSLGKINPESGKRVRVDDPETGELMDAIDDQLLDDALALTEGRDTETLSYVPSGDVSLRAAVPAYYDRRFQKRFRAALQAPSLKGFTSATLGDLVAANVIEIRGGHGSPSHEMRVGEVPYIKVSDLRAGLVNINPTNRVPMSIAEQFWRGKKSGLRAFDLVCPERTSKNIGDFCVLMPGQEQVLFTKEMIVLRPSATAGFDPFFLLWAMTLKVVRDQWRRVIFMQTNREDVGKRYLEIEIPIALDVGRAAEVSEPFRTYYQSLAKARVNLRSYLLKTKTHHFFVSGAEEISDTGED